MTAAVQTSVPSALSDDDLAMLRFAGLWWHQGGSSDAAIVERFGITPIRFYQRLAFLVEQPAALAAEPVIVNRLARVVAARRAGRRHVSGARP